MEDLYILSYTLEDGSQKEVSFTAESFEEAKQLVASDIRGGEGLLSSITLCDGNSVWEYEYSDCAWHMFDDYDF